jgi:hypothetical protein
MDVMAILKHGINGPFSGKVGNIVGYELNGQNVIRSLSSYTKRKPTALTLINRGRMAAVSKFLSPLKRVIAFGYRNVVQDGNRVGTFQMAQSQVFKQALAYGEGAVPYVDPEKVFLFRGELPTPQRLEAVRNEHSISVSWHVEPHTFREAVLLLVAYDPEKSFVLFEEGGAKASRGVFDWEVSQSVLDTFESLHIYGGFYDIVRDRRSDSVYAGCV